MNAPLPDVGWTEERVEALKRLWTAGNSCSEIARTLGGLSRNAVIGKITRLGLKRKKAVVTRRSNTLALAGLRPAPTVVAKAKATPRFGPKPSPVPIPPTPSKDATATRPSDPAPLMLSLDQLNWRTCRWPIGTPGQPDFGFCGHRVATEGAYCPAHKARAFAPRAKAPTGKELTRSLRRYL